MKKVPYLSLLLGCAITLAGCDENTNQEGMDVIPVVVVDDSTFTAYLKMAAVDITVEKGEIREDILQLDISFLGGCEEHVFELIAAKGIAKSNPPVGYILLIHDTNADTCTAEMSEVLFIDLSPYREYLQSSGLVRSGTISVSINYGLYGFKYHF